MCVYTMACYMAFRGKTADLIFANLPDDNFTQIVKVL